MDLDAAALVTRPGALPERTPFFVGDDMRPREPITSYFFDLANYVGAGSLENYAYDVMALEDFLGTVLDPPTDLLSATEDDLVAYRRYRTALQPSPVRPATWRRNRVSIDGFYDWAVDTGLLEARPYRVRRNGRDALSGGPVQDLDVRHLTHRQWVLLQRVGLGGDLPDGSSAPSFRGGHRLRNMAAGELAVTSGMRLREFSCLLDIEMAAPRPDREPATVGLQAIAKYGFARQTVVQHPVLRSLDLYRRTERAALVARSWRALWARRAELFVVDSVDTARMRLSGQLHGRRRSFAVAAMPAGLRRITVIEGARGLEPMALFVGRGGRMIGKSRWEQIFTAASERARRLSAEFGDVVMPRQVRIHDLRHTFAVYMLKILTLQLVRAETERLAAGGPQAYLFDHIARAPLLVLQRLLGHRDPRSTMKYLRYLEDLSAIVAQAAEEWTREDCTFADYALLVAGRGGL
ncbi:recombinase XerD [Streptomyces sp. NPDC002668]|uniref:recombinase XerD n=1 Tax=Streptomyces sp. NPDC002668 TaxID=3154422 RepID=UPI0033300765